VRKKERKKEEIKKKPQFKNIMACPISYTAAIKRKKERKKQDKNIMSESATLGGHNKRQEENLYGLPYYIGRP